MPRCARPAAVALVLLVAALVLGSLVLQSANQGQYLLALAETLILIAAALVALSWLMSPTAGFAGFNQLLSRYLMSVGLPAMSGLSLSRPMSSRGRTL